MHLPSPIRRASLLLSLPLALLLIDGVRAGDDDGGGDAPPPAAAGPAWRVVAWNNLGMHCMDDDFEVFSLLPPFNTIHAQVIHGGQRVTDPSGILVTYEAVADPAGSINRTSQGKTDFWQHVPALFGVALPEDQGLFGAWMPGLANLPQPMHFDAALGAFTAEGIPITPRDDQGQVNTYPMMRVRVRDAALQTLATTDIVLPVSDEMSCIVCHGSGSGPAAMPAAGWVNDPDPSKDYRLNVLRLHDERNAPNPAYGPLLTTAGYDAAGLFATATSGATSILCARCHLSNALPGSGLPGAKPLTEAIHGKHAGVVDPTNGLILEQSANRSACYRCHPGSLTKCLRGAMGSAVAADGTLAMQCQQCHGNMSAVGKPGRVGWLDQPACQSCHTGTAVLNSGQIRFTSVFDANGVPHVAASPLFATNPNVPAAGFSLYQFSKGHGGLLCEACHGSTHAEYPSSHQNDNVQSLQVQGHEGTIADCSACHVTTPNTVTGGPHGMHPIGGSWIEGHGEVAEDGGSNACKACHGGNLKGTVLSRALGDRVFSADDYGTKKFWRGFTIGCYACHDGPNSEQPSSNHPPKATSLTLSVSNTQPASVPLKASDADGDALSLRVVKQPAHGTAGWAGALATYFPDPDYVGPDSFTFAAWDGRVDSNLGTIALEVTDPGCPTTVLPASMVVGVPGAARPVTIGTPPTCNWQVEWDGPPPPWLTVEPKSGTGPAEVLVTVDPNLGDGVRDAVLRIRGRAVDVVQAGASSPDLRGTWLKTSAKCKGPRCWVRGRLLVENAGQSKSPKSRVRFYLSADAALDDGDLALGSLPVKRLAPGAAVELVVKDKLPKGVDPSGWSLIAVLDAKQQVAELDEDDDVVTSPALP